MFKHILVPTDGSELSYRTVKRSVVFAKETGATITFLYVQDEPPVPLSDLSDTAHYEPEKTRHYKDEAMKYASKVLDAAAEHARKAGIVANVVSETNDSPYAEIVRVAETRNCDLIFMASHGRRGLGALLLGSETHKVLTHSKIPVLVYR